MIPPSFADFGKSSRDLFDKKFKFGYVTIEHKSASSKNFDLTLNGESEFKAGKISGSLQSKHKVCPARDVSINTKLDTKNVLNIDTVMTDTFVTGLKNTISVVFNPNKEEFITKLKTAYKRDYLNTTFDMDMKSQNCCSVAPPVITASAVVGGCPAEKYNGFYAGGEIIYDSNAKALQSNQFRVGYESKDLGIVTNILKCSQFQALIYQKVKSDLQVGVNFQWNKDTKQSNFGVATQYEIDRANKSFVKAKINNNSQLGLTYGWAIAEGINAHVTTLVDAKNLEGGNHNVGVGIDFAF